ncbi:hypothetical protein J7E79_29475 [Bacillus sp. ISL-40]|uniref:hypothetical protein n=1 Tax=unclassified Bacillus (in: firmicutes) TaxID=185979 RepID=UPI001BE738F9|nr:MULTISPECIES: hypothetical protein [unclassified Bacillus (in: firmicutes)]MBT2701390.1 hypothetical protein [Bacillus sp. ISL-40]MBT2743643.1 hypothetical protein [Bacillus sp. ISL-77]
MSDSKKRELPDNYYLLVDELLILLPKFGGLEKMQFLGVRAINTGNFYYWKLIYNGHNLLVRVADQPLSLSNKHQTYLVSFSNFNNIEWYFAPIKELREITITVKD